MGKMLVKFWKCITLLDYIRALENKTNKSKKKKIEKIQ